MILRRTLELRSSSLLSLKAQLKLTKGKLRSRTKKGLKNLGSKSSKMSLTLLRESTHHCQTQLQKLMKNLGLESKTKTLNCAEVTAILKSSIDDILFEDTTTRDNLYTFPLFETDDVMNSKINVMKSNFAYLSDVFSDGSVHCIDQNAYIFDIHSICTEPFNIGTENEPCILHILKNITLEERREIDKIFKSIFLDI